MLLSLLEAAEPLLELQSSSLSLSIMGSVAEFSPKVFSREFIFTSPRNVKFDGMGVGTCYEADCVPSKVTIGSL